MNKTLLVIVCMFVSGIAMADRFHSPVYVGTGSANAAQVVFDVGNGSTNPYIGSTSGGSLALSNNGGTNIISIPTITDTVATLTATQTLTNKTLSGGYCRIDREHYRVDS
jgi:hypothetical protein